MEIELAKLKQKMNIKSAHVDMINKDWVLINWVILIWDYRGFVIDGKRKIGDLVRWVLGEGVEFLGF